MRVSINKIRLKLKTTPIGLNLFKFKLLNEMKGKDGYLISWRKTKTKPC